MTYFGRLSYRQGTLKIKILSFLGLGLVLVATRYMFLSSDGDASFHLHHTTSALVVMCLCKFQNTTSLIIASIFMGIIVDGIVKWSEWNYFDTWMTSPSYVVSFLIHLFRGLARVTYTTLTLLTLSYSSLEIIPREHSITNTQTQVHAICGQRTRDSERTELDIT